MFQSKSITSVLCKLIGCCTLAVFVSPSDAQLLDPQTIYGKGIHAFHQNDLGEAISLIDEAIDMGTLDPRPFYYRGVIYWMQGDEDLARENFEEAAELEAANAGIIYAVDRSLERVQGMPRVELEKFRAEAKVRAIRSQQEAIAEEQKLLDEVDQQVTVLRGRMEELDRSEIINPRVDLFGDTPGDVLEIVPMAPVEPRNPIASQPLASPADSELSPLNPETQALDELEMELEERQVAEEAVPQMREPTDTEEEIEEEEKEKMEDDNSLPTFEEPSFDFNLPGFDN
ncbi:Hypothetical protein PBC10988_15550 [Planctomycetales bacterium 10988]|nr:Hypothetical protein PBC10988_15550 [Planctomycetales bacterium 10988]